MQEGYKIFNSKQENRYGYKMEKGKTYSVKGNLSYGICGNGYHFCKNLSDVFRFKDTKYNDFLVAHVIGSGKIITYNDEYYGYYDLYSCEKLFIKDFLKREDIIIKMLNETDTFSLKNFITTFTMTKEEIALFKEKLKNNIELINLIAYYQEKDLKVYEKIYLKRRTYE